METTILCFHRYLLPIHTPTQGYVKIKVFVHPVLNGWGLEYPTEYRIVKTSGVSFVTICEYFNGLMIVFLSTKPGPRYQVRKLEP